MEGLVALLLEIAGRFPLAIGILGALGSLVVLGQALVVLTPSSKDNELLDKVEKNSIGKMVLKALLAFAPIRKK